jgi:hypothetical protein
VVVQVSWERSGTGPEGEYSFFYGKVNKNLELGTGSFVHKRIISAVKMVVSDRLSYTMLRGRWFHIIVPNVHNPTKHKIDNVKDSFYEELERIFDKFHKYYMKFLLGISNAKVGKKDNLNRRLGMKVYTKIVMIMESE